MRFLITTATWLLFSYQASATCKQSLVETLFGKDFIVLMKKREPNSMAYAQYVDLAQNIRQYKSELPPLTYAANYGDLSDQSNSDQIARMDNVLRNIGASPVAERSKYIRLLRSLTLAIFAKSLMDAPPKTREVRKKRWAKHLQVLRHQFEKHIPWAVDGVFCVEPPYEWVVLER